MEKERARRAWGGTMRSTARWGAVAALGAVLGLTTGCETQALMVSHGFVACATTLMLWSTLNVVGRR